VRAVMIIVFFSFSTFTVLIAIALVHLRELCV
jgi:hypothetical protein